LAWLIIGPIPDGHTVGLSAIAYAGWAGLFITMLNLLPLGQLDGGHIVYGLIGRRQKITSKIFLAFLLVLGFWWMGWWVFGALIFIFGLKHPPTLDDNFQLAKSTRIMGISAIVIFIICFMPIPLAV
jgi:membrane-associated protease RseP (regulator of RpoE activity)